MHSKSSEHILVEFVTEQFSACALGWRTSFTNAHHNASWPTSSVTMSGPSTMTRHCVLELQRILTTSCSLCDTMTKKFSVCPHSTCDVSQVELKVHIQFLSRCNLTLLVQQCDSVRNQRLKHNKAGDAIDPKLHFDHRRQPQRLVIDVLRATQHRTPPENTVTPKYNRKFPVWPHSICDISQAELKCKSRSTLQSHAQRVLKRQSLDAEAETRPQSMPAPATG